MVENKTSHYYIIKSKDKGVGQTSVNFEVQPHRFNHIRSFEIKKIIIPYFWYPINSNNNTFVVNEPGAAGTDITVTIAPGEYNLSQFKTAVIAGYTTSAATGTLSFTTTLEANQHKFILASTVSFIYKGTLSAANTLLGFNSVDTSDAVTQTSDNVFNVTGTNHIELYSHQLTKYDSRVRNSSATSRNLLAIIPISNYVFGQVIEWTPPSAVTFDYHRHAEGDIDIQLRNEDNQILGGDDGLNNSNIVIDLQFHSYSSNHPNVRNRVNVSFRNNLTDNLP